MSGDIHQRTIFLNRLVSRTVSQAPHEYDPPLHSAFDLLKLIEGRANRFTAIEYYDSDDDKDETKRRANGAGKEFLNLRQITFEETEQFRYATLLFEFADPARKSFPVLHLKTLEGRELRGEPDEAGAFTSHFMVKMPKNGSLDELTYRCTIEHSAEIGRRDIETFLCRQIRREATEGEWSFSVSAQARRRSTQRKEYKYHPRLELFADVGRSLNLAVGHTLSHIVFTQRGQRQSLGAATSIIDNDVIADVDIRISARQGPPDPHEKMTWLKMLRDVYASRGYTSRVYYRHVGGGSISGEMNKAVAGAADLLMCPKEFVELPEKPRAWRAAVDEFLVAKMKVLLDTDALWERGQ